MTPSAPRTAGASGASRLPAPDAELLAASGDAGIALLPLDDDLGSRSWSTRHGP